MSIRQTRTTATHKTTKNELAVVLNVAFGNNQICTRLPLCREGIFLLDHPLRLLRKNYHSSTYSTRENVKNV